MRSLLKRWWFWTLLIGVFVLIAWTVLHEESPQLKAVQIKIGMTKEEVLEIMGSQPTLQVELIGTQPTREYENYMWCDGSAKVVVTFKDKRVWNRQLHLPPNIFQRAIIWVRWVGQHFLQL